MNNSCNLLILCNPKQVSSPVKLDGRILNEFPFDKVWNIQSKLLHTFVNTWQEEGRGLLHFHTFEFNKPPKTETSHLRYSSTLKMFVIFKNISPAFSRHSPFEISLPVLYTMQSVGNPICIEEERLPSILPSRTTYLRTRVWGARGCIRLPETRFRSYGNRISSTVDTFKDCISIVLNFSSARII